MNVTGKIQEIKIISGAVKPVRKMQGVINKSGGASTGDHIITLMGEMTVRETVPETMTYTAEE